SASADVVLRQELAAFSQAKISSSRAKSRDPVEVTFKLSQRDPSTSLGMTVLRFRIHWKMLVLQMFRDALRLFGFDFFAGSGYRFVSFAAFFRLTHVSG